MARILPRWRVRFRRERQLGLLFGLLLCATIVVLAVWILDLYGLARTAQSWSDLFAPRSFLLRAVLPLFESKLFQAFVLVAGWSFWFGVKRRQLDQIRLRRSEHKYRNIINHAGEAIFLLDGDGRVLEWNKAAERLFGTPRRNVLGRPFRDIHLCYGLRIDQAMADAEKLARSLQFEFPFPRPGRPGGLISLVISAISTGVDNGDQLGRAFVVIARDITSEKQLETKMSETEKLAGIGQLAAGIAHQLNTPLGSILLSAQMLEESVADEDQQEDIRRIIRQTDQCRTIIKGLLNFARPSGSERGQLHLGELVRETAYLLEKNIKLAGVEVKVHEKNPALIYGNRNEIDQVFFNLLTNALDAMPHGGEITITMGDGAPGEVLVEFADQGQGIATENREQVFLPFFSTKEYGKGTGLGLSIVARIVHEHGGRITMDSEVGQGTVFYISFPKPGFGLISRQENRTGLPDAQHPLPGQGR
jgi:PAS domain S-box-containing protein